MKFSTAYKPLLAALSACADVAEKRAHFPVLSNVMLRCQGNRAVLRAFNLDQCLDVVLAAADMPTLDGAVTFPAHDALKFLKAAKCDLVELELIGEHLAVRAGNGRLSLPTLPIADFPQPAASQFRQMAPSFEVDAADWRAAVDRIKFAVSSEQTRYYLNGVYFEVVEQKGKAPRSRLVATDGHRLAIVDWLADLPKGVSSGIIPTAALTALGKILPKRGVVTIWAELGCTVMAWGETIFRTKNVDGTFPDWQRVMPTKNGRKASIPRAELAALLPRVMAATTDKARTIKLTFKRGQLSVSAVSADGFAATESLAVSWEGESLEISLNGKYLADAVKATDGVDIDLEMDNALAPVVLRDRAAPAWRAVQMPMRI